MAHRRPPRFEWLLTGILALVAISTVTGCSAKTKAGAGSAHTLTLTMAAPDGDDADAAYFAEQVKDRTDGRVRIVIDGDTYSSTDPDNELRLVRDLRRGKDAIAYLPSRAWERDGINAFRALQAPFLVRDYRLLRQITTGPIGASMLTSLDKVGLVGLGLVPKELRRPLGRRPLVTLSAFRGARIRVVTSPTSVLDLRALGARPLTNYDAHEVSTALANGRLDGVESETHSIITNGYTSLAPYLPSNLVLFAKAQTIVIRRTALTGLSGQDQDALRAAAAATVAHADPAQQERAEIAELCRNGLLLVHATESALAALRRASASADAALNVDPVTRRAIAAIEALASSSPAASLPPCTRAKSTTPTAQTPFPEGTFESRLTEADFAAGGTHPDPGFPLAPGNAFRMTIHNGRFHTNEQPPFSGRVIVRGDEVTFAIEQPPDANGVRETVKWSYYRGKLTFRIVDVAASGGRVIYTAHPWRKIAP